MYQLRIYTLKDEVSADIYLQVHWQRHLISLPKYKIHVHQVFKEQHSLTNMVRVVALVSCDEKEDINVLNTAYMQSVDFVNDMAGFEMNAILKVEAVELQAIKMEVGDY